MADTFDLDTFKTYWDPDLRNDGWLLRDLVGGAAAIQIRHAVEQAITQSVRRLASLQFQRLTLQGWPDAGELDTRRGYAHAMLGLDMGQTPTEEQMQQSLDQLRRSDVARLTADELQNLEKNWAVPIMERSIPIHQQERINTELEFVESRKRIMCGMEQTYRIAIFGDCTVETDSHGFRTMKFGRESARTPVAALIISAYADLSHCSTIREEAAAHVARNKWMPQIRRILSGDRHILGTDPLDHASQWINLKAASCFVRDFGRDEPQLLHRVQSDVFHHSELFCKGRHFLLGKISLPLMAVAQAIVSRLRRMTFRAVEETLTQAHAPLSHWLALCEKDPLVAERMLMTFMSDYLFQDATTPRISGLSDIFLSAVLTASTLGGAVQFNVLGPILQGLYDLCLSRFEAAMTTVRDAILNAKYVVNGERYPFDYIQRQIDSEAHTGDSDTSLPEREHLHEVAFWHDALLKMEQFSPDFPALIAKLDELEAQMRSDILKMLCPAHCHRYGAKMHDCLLDHLRRVFPQTSHAIG